MTEDFSGDLLTGGRQRRVTRLGDQIDLENPVAQTVAGFSLHANTAVPARDRHRLERLAQYCARPPVAMERLDLLQPGVLLKVKGVDPDP